jgi:hypothetical protein
MNVVINTAQGRKMSDAMTTSRQLLPSPGHPAPAAIQFRA